MNAIGCNIPTPLALLTADGRLADSNPAWQASIGAFLSGGSLMVQLAHASGIRLADLQARLSAILARSEVAPSDSLLLRLGRPERSFALSGSLMTDGAHILLSALDVTLCTQQSRQVQAQLERLELALGSGQDGVWDWQLPTAQFFMSPSLEALLGYGSGELAHSIDAWRSLQDPEDNAARAALLHDLLSDKVNHFACDHRMITKGGALIWVSARGRVVERDDSGKALRMTGTVRDISERKAFEQRLIDYAERDHLTSLLNKRKLEEAMEALRVRKVPDTAFIMIDLDGFKQINDSHGHDVGDVLLTRMAQRISSHIRPQDKAFRIGGDEFVVLLQDVQSFDIIREISLRLVHSLKALVVVKDIILKPSATLGAAWMRAPHDTADAALRRADAALYAAKRAGRNRVIFDIEIQQQRVA
jgi:diguanylate cyclase (GGDEF)-like protein/PAS domain S-box-containing protein